MQRVHSSRPAPRVLVIATTTLLAWAGCASGAVSNAAETPVAQATGQLLSGAVAGQDLARAVELVGEQASNDGSRKEVVNHDNLNLTALGAVKIPAPGGIQLPGFDVAQFGAVSQYARARNDGTALGAAGAVDDTGAIGIGGTGAAPSGFATIDLAGLGGGTVARTLANVALKLGAISSRAVQPAGRAPFGEYNIAGLAITVDLPAIAAVVQPLLDAFAKGGTTFTSTINTALASSGLGNQACTPKLPAFGGNQMSDRLGRLEIPSSGPGAGAVVVDLPNGHVELDLAKVLQAMGLDVNNLPPDTELVRTLVEYLTTHLGEALHTLLSGLADELAATVSDLALTLDCPDPNKDITLSAAQLAPVLDALTTAFEPLATRLSDGGKTLAGAMAPALDQLADQVAIVVNHQERSSSKPGSFFKEVAVQVKVGGTARLLELNLATATVGPGAPRVAPPTSAAPEPTQPRPAGRIVINAGHQEPAGSNPMLPLGLALLVIGTAGLVMTHRRRAGHR